MDNTDLTSKVQEAKQAGYNDTQIADFLSKKDPRITEARQAGHKDEDIINHIAPPEKGYFEKVSDAYHKSKEIDARNEDGHNGLKGALEAVGQAVTSTVAPILVLGREPDKSQYKQDPNKPAKSKQEWYDEEKAKKTYTPKTESGKADSELLGAVFSPIGHAIDWVGKKLEHGLESTGVSEEKAKLAHDLSNDFLPFLAPEAGKLATAGVKPAVSGAISAAAKGVSKTGEAIKGLELGKRALNSLVDEGVPKYVKPEERTKFLEAADKAVQNSEFTNVLQNYNSQLTRAQVTAKAARELGYTEEANKTLQAEHKAAESHPEILNHYTEQAKAFVKSLDRDLIENKNIAKEGNEYAFIKDFAKEVKAKAVQMDKDGNVTGIDAKIVTKMYDELESAELEKLASVAKGKGIATDSYESIKLDRMRTFLKPYVDTAQAFSHPAIKGETTLASTATDIVKYVKENPGGALRKVAAGTFLTKPYLGLKASQFAYNAVKNKAIAENFNKPSKLTIEAYQKSVEKAKEASLTRELYEDSDKQE